MDPKRAHVAGVAVDDFEWAKDYAVVWRLLLQGLVQMGSRTVILLFVYLQICPYSPNWYKVAMVCNPETIGVTMAYPCEGSKAFVRCFPLLAASISLITTKRYILQRRLYYHMLVKQAFLDYSEYHPMSDLGFKLVVGCLIGSMSHFALAFGLRFRHLFADSGFISEGGRMLVADISEIYVVPCALFLILFWSFVHIDQHLVPMAKFYEEDPTWAKNHLKEAELYSDVTISTCAEKAQNQLAGESSYDIDELLRKTFEMARGGQEDQDLHSRKFSDLFAGLWPAKILLDPKLNDPGSILFRKAFKVLSVFFLAVHLTILFLLSLSAAQEILDATQANIPVNFQALVVEGSTSKDVGGNAYELVGDGYCRDAHFLRPPGHSRYWDDMLDPGAVDEMGPGEVRGLEANVLAQGARTRHARAVGSTLAAAEEISPVARATATHLASSAMVIDPYLGLCASHCSDTPDCIAFSRDLDACSIYLKKSGQAPPGWSSWADHDAAAAVDVFTVVQSNGAPESQCWRKFVERKEPQDIVGAVVYAAHFIVILYIIIQNVRKIHVRRKPHAISEQPVVP